MNLRKKGCGETGKWRPVFSLGVMRKKRKTDNGKRTQKCSQKAIAQSVRGNWIFARDRIRWLCFLGWCLLFCTLFSRPTMASSSSFPHQPIYSKGFSIKDGYEGSDGYGVALSGLVRFVRFLAAPFPRFPDSVRVGFFPSYYKYIALSNHAAIGLVEELSLKRSNYNVPTIIYRFKNDKSYHCM